MKYLAVAAVASAITLFALQNPTPTSVRFLLWSLRDLPLAAVILVSVAGGIVLAGLPLALDRWRLRARIRALEARDANMQAAREVGRVPPSVGAHGSPSRSEGTHTRRSI